MSKTTQQPQQQPNQPQQPQPAKQRPTFDELFNMHFRPGKPESTKSNK